MARRTTKTAGPAGGNRRTGVSTLSPSPTPVPPQTGGGRPWHLLVLGVMMSAAAGAVATREGGTVLTVSIVVTILTVGLVAAGLLRTFGPLVAADAGEETEMLAGRTRAALEREKMLVLRSIKEVEFDRAMRKISDADYNEIVPRLRIRAVGLIRQLEGGGGYRSLIERDLAALMPAPTPAPGERRNPAQNSVIPANAGSQPCTSLDPGIRRGDDDLFNSSREGSSKNSGPEPPGTCPDCATINDKDARFCKSCGARLAGDA